MNKAWKLLFLFAASSSLLLTGCRRQPVETETELQSETETETETKTEKQTETKTVPSTEKQTEKKTVSSSKTNTTKAGKKTSVSPSETNATEKQAAAADSSAVQTCPYCGQSFSTIAGADGSSEYSTHYAQEKAYADMYGIQPGGTSSGSETSNSDSTGTGTASEQCPYCYQWFSTAADASGYSPYGEHLAAESAYAASLSAQQNQQYQECPYCGQWLDTTSYQDHITNGY